MYVCFACMYQMYPSYIWCWSGQEETQPQALELRVFASHHVGAENRTEHQVLIIAKPSPAPLSTSVFEKF